MDQWRTFQDLEYYLQSPALLQSQTVFQIETESQLELVSKYWGFDHRLGRHLMGRKLSSQVRQGLEEVSTKYDLPLFACERMFDNLKSLSKELEGTPPRIAEDISLQTFLETSYRLPRDMALAYTQIVFACHHNFDLTSKKLHLLDFATVLRVLGTFTRTFSKPTGPECLSIDEEFTANLNKAQSLIPTPTAQSLPLCLANRLGSRSKISYLTRP